MCQKTPFIYIAEFNKENHGALITKKIPYSAEDCQQLFSVFHRDQQSLYISDSQGNVSVYDENLKFIQK